MANKGKNRRRQLTAFDETHQITLSVDSVEEQDFVHWLDEAKSLSVINDYQYQPDSFLLADAVKFVDVNGKQRTLFREHCYSSDFCIMFDANRHIDLAKEFKISFEQFNNPECSVFIDVKGTFNRNARSFSTDRKWVWQKFKVFIYELIPQKFFKLFGCPEKCRLTEKTKKPRNAFRGFMSLKQIFRLK